MIGRITFLFSMGLLLTACVSAPNPFGLPSDTQSAFNDTTEAAFLKAYPELAQRHGKTLNLRFSNGQTTTFEDKEEAECDSRDVSEGDVINCYITHRVIGYSPERKTFLMDLLFYEGDATRLVHDDSTYTDIAGRPVFSPDGKSFSTYFSDCYHFYPVNVEIWQWESLRPEKRFEDSVGVCVAKLKWLSNARLRVYMNNGDVPDKDRQAWSETLVIATDGHWRWIENDERRKVGDIPTEND